MENGKIKREQNYIKFSPCVMIYSFGTTMRSMRGLDLPSASALFQRSDCRLFLYRLFGFLSLRLRTHMLREHIATETRIARVCTYISITKGISHPLTANALLLNLHWTIEHYFSIQFCGSAMKPDNHLCFSFLFAVERKRKARKTT